MIIKIEGLPQGQKIKHINVDIQFEDDGSAVVKTSTDVQQTDEPKEDIKFDEIVKDHPAVEDSHREKKAIPSEMTDMEF